MIHIVKMVETCGACPSQWNGWSDDGTYYYFRYRWGTLRVDREDTQGTQTIYEKDHGDSLDGYLSYNELRQHVADILSLPDHTTID